MIPLMLKVGQRFSMDDLTSVCDHALPSAVVNVKPGWKAWAAWAAKCGPKKKGLAIAKPLV